jgi:hypothetical protein
MIDVPVGEQQDRVTELFDKYNLLALPGWESGGGEGTGQWFEMLDITRRFEQARQLRESAAMQRESAHERITPP